MRAVIIGNGQINDYEYIKSKIRSADFIICADGGYNHALKMGITPDILIGDLDSAENIGAGIEKLRYPERKDFTDGELAIDYALKKGYGDILLLSMTGDRADHTITDILLMTKCANACMIDDNNEIYILRDKLKIEGKKGDTVSIVPIGGDVSGVTTEGLEYPLDRETLYFGASRGVSNVMNEDGCAITAENGIALVIKVRNV